MTKLQQALERGEPLLILLDFEMFDAAGTSFARHRFSMNWHADSSGQYDDRLVEFGYRLRSLGDFGSSGLAEMTEQALRLAGSAELASFREDVAVAAKTVLSVRAATKSLDEADLIHLGRFEAVKTRDDEDGSLSVDLDSSDRYLHQARIPIETYLGLGQALDAAASPAVLVYDTTKTEADGDPRLDPVDAFYIGAWIRLAAAPASQAILSRRTEAPGSSVLVLEWVIGPDLHPSVSLRSGAGQWVTVDATDLEVPLAAWTFVEIRWSQETELLECRVNGAGSEFAAPVPDLSASTSRLAINEGSSIPGLLAEYRYATQSIDPGHLDRRASRTLEEGEIGDYVLYFTFDEEHLVDTRTVFDLSPNGLDGRAEGGVDFLFTASETGTRELAGVGIPRVIGLASYMEGRAVSGDGLIWRFCQGPVRAFRRVFTSEHFVFWLKLSQVVEGELTPASLKRAAGSSVDLSSFKRFQTVRVRSATGNVARVVSLVYHDVIHFQHHPDETFAFSPSGIWTVETIDPRRQLVQSVQAVSASGTVTVSLFEGEGFFKQARIGQKLVIPDPLFPVSRIYTIASILGSPFDSVTVSEPIQNQLQESVIVGLDEYFDAVADLEAGTLLLTAHPGELFADVVAETEPTPRGVIEYLYGLANLPTVSLPELDAFETDFGLSLGEDRTVASVLQQAAGSLDGVVFPDLETGEIRFEALSAPAAAAELDFPEVVAVRRIDETEPFEALRLEYRQHGTSSEWESVVVPHEGATLRRDAPTLSTFLQEAASAGERAEAAFELRKNGQEVYDVDLPLRYFVPNLVFRSVSFSGAQRLAGRTWRVIGLGVTAPGLCRLLVWRNLP